MICKMCTVLQYTCNSVQYTLSVEKIPVVLRPVIKLLVKSMASIGTQEIRRKPKFKNFIDFGEILKRLARNYR